MVTIEQLKSELKEKEKGCGHTFIKESEVVHFRFNCGELYAGGERTAYCNLCQAEIQALKKGIEACEEIIGEYEKYLDDYKKEVLDIIENEQTYNLDGSEGCGIDRDVLKSRLTKQQFTTKEEAER